MRLTEFFSYINETIPSGYQFYHLDISSVKANKKVKAFKKEIKKHKKEEMECRKNGTEITDIFGEN